MYSTQGMFFTGCIVQSACNPSEPAFLYASPPPPKPTKASPE